MRCQIFFARIFGMAFFWATAGWLQADPLIGLVGGDGYGRTEVQSIIRNVLERELPQEVYEDCGEFLAPEDFSKYRLVVLAGPHSDRSYTSEEVGRIEDYIRQGGNLLLINQSPKMFPVVEDKDQDSSYLFGRSYYLRDNPTASVFQPDADMLQGAFVQGSNPSWLQGTVMLKGPEWESFVGKDDFILVGRRSLEKGRVYYLGSELFRLLQADKNNGTADAEGWVKILTNVLSAKGS